MLEAVIKVVKSIIQKHVDKYGSNWDQHLQSAAFAISSNVNSGSGVKPAELIIGKVLKHPSDIENYWNEENLPPIVKQA